MGVVYLGAPTNDDDLSRVVAIKVLHENLAVHPRFIDMLMDEADIAGQLSHPNVVGVCDSGEVSGRPFVVMPYVEGGTLSELAKKHHGKLPLGIAVRIMIDVLHGLHAAHSASDAQGQPLGLVHRDVSPGNILIGTDGIARVIDFGVAKATARLSDTSPGTVKGKFSYMSPEQVGGEPIDHRADIFSAGVVLWTALTGERLFTGDNDAQILRNVLSGTIRWPSQVRGDVPASLDMVCATALAHDPANRFQSAAKMAEALYRVARAEGLVASAQDLSDCVSSAFARRISRRRHLLEQLRSCPRAGTDGEFKREITDPDRMPDGLATITPSSWPYGDLSELSPSLPGCPVIDDDEPGDAPLRARSASPYPARSTRRGPLWVTAAAGILAIVLSVVVWWAQVGDSARSAAIDTPGAGAAASLSSATDLAD